MNVLFLRTAKEMYQNSAYLLSELVSESSNTIIQRIPEVASVFVPKLANIDVIVDRSLQERDEFFHALTETSEQLKVPVVNHPLAALAATDKTTYSQMYGNDTIPTSVVSSESEVNEAFFEFEKAIVIKVPRGRRGEGIERMIATYDEKLVRTMLTNPYGHVIVQPYLRGLKKGDKRVMLQKDNVDQYHIVGQYMKIPGDNQWKSNVSLGGYVVHCNLTSEEIELSYRVAQKSNLDAVGLDIGEHEGKPWLIEVNSYPGGYVRLDDPQQRAVRMFIDRIKYLADTGWQESTNPSNI